MNIIPNSEIIIVKAIDRENSLDPRLKGGRRDGCKGSDMNHHGLTDPTCSMATKLDLSNKSPPSSIASPHHKDCFSPSISEYKEESGDHRRLSIEEGVIRECEAYSQLMNQLLSSYKDKLNKYLPLQGSTLLSSMRDGVLFGYMIHSLSPEVIDLSTLKYNLDLGKINHQASKVIFEVTNNHNLVIKAAKALGIKMINIGPEDILSMNLNLMLGMIWQLVKMYYIRRINFESHPELVKLVEKNESLTDLLNLTSEAILLRWFNYHLSKSKSSLTITNLSKDLSDSVAYAYLLSQLVSKAQFPAGFIDQVLSIQEEEEENKKDSSSSSQAHLERAELILSLVRAVGIKTIASPQDIVSGHSKLNLCLVADLFNHYVGNGNEQDVRALTSENEYLKTKLQSLEAEMNQNKMTIDSERKAWESLLIEERLTYSKKLHEVEDSFNFQLEEWKRKYQAEISEETKKCTTLKHFYERYVESLCKELDYVSQSIVELNANAAKTLSHAAKHLKNSSLKENLASDASPVKKNQISNSSSDVINTLTHLSLNDEWSAIGIREAHMCHHSSASVKRLNETMKKVSDQVAQMNPKNIQIHKLACSLIDILERKNQLNDLLSVKVREITEDYIESSQQKKESKKATSTWKRFLPHR